MGRGVALKEYSMPDWKVEGRIAIYIASEMFGASGDDVEHVANTTPVPEQARDIMAIVEADGYLKNKKLGSYRGAWKKLYEDVLDEKTGWGKEELKKRMDKLLIEELERNL